MSADAVLLEQYEDRSTPLYPHQRLLNNYDGQGLRPTLI